MIKSKIISIIVIAILIFAIFLVISNILGINVFQAFTDSTSQNTGAAFCK